MVENPVRWFEIYVKDMPRAKRFYETVFALKLERLSTPSEMKDTGLELWNFPSNKDGWGTSGALARMPGLEPSGVSTIVYFGSDDCAIEEKRVAPAGGKVHRSKMSIGPYGFISLVIDTEGNTIGIHSMK